MRLQRQVEQTPPLHEYGSSMPCASAASSTVSLFFSSVKERVRPSWITVTSHCCWPICLCACAAGLADGMLVANSSRLMRVLSTPLSSSACETSSIIECGPQIKATSISCGLTQCLSSALTLSPSMRPLNRSISSCSRLSTNTRLKRCR
ncbi:hypothetical protein D9M70_604830 [compost metagenome]